MQVKDLGEKHLKNVTRPIRVYALWPTALPGQTRTPGQLDGLDAHFVAGFLGYAYENGALEDRAVAAGDLIFVRPGHWRSGG